jgi:hypothetical protein
MRVNRGGSGGKANGYRGPAIHTGKTHLLS